MRVVIEYALKRAKLIVASRKGKGGEPKGPDEKQSLAHKKSRQRRSPSIKLQSEQPDAMTRLQLRIRELDRQNEELRSQLTGVAEQDAKYRHIYEFSPIGCFTLDEGGKVTEANETSALLLGVERKALPGRHFQDFIDEASGNIFSLYLKRLIETAEKRSIELRLVREDGYPMYGSITGIPVNVPGHSFEMHFALIDITKSKETMDKLQEIYAVLIRGGAKMVGVPRPSVLAKDITVEDSKTSEEGESAMKEIEERIVLNINDLVLPHIDGLRRSNLDAEQKKSLAAIEERLRDIAGPFMQKALSRYANLTPREIQIAGLIRYGRTTKEIAQTIGISSNAVEIHRASLRKKFNLKHRKANLRSFLLTLPL